MDGRLAQSPEHRANNARVVGSSPTLTIGLSLFSCIPLYEIKGQLGSSLCIFMLANSMSFILIQQMNLLFMVDET